MSERADLLRGHRHALRMRVAVVAVWRREMISLHVTNAAGSLSPLGRGLLSLYSMYMPACKGNCGDRHVDYVCISPLQNCRRQQVETPTTSKRIIASSLEMCAEFQNIICTRSKMGAPIGYTLDVDGSPLAPADDTAHTVSITAHTVSIT